MLRTTSFQIVLLALTTLVLGTHHRIQAESTLAQETLPWFASRDSLHELPDGAFTIVVIPDTQHYEGAGCKHGPESIEPVTNHHLDSQIRWIIENRDSENIVFVSHVGDIVDINRAEEWAVAKRQIDRLRGVVPFSLTVGNHDMEPDGDARLFQATFPASSFEKYPWYLESYHHHRSDQHVSSNNVNSVQLFSHGDLDFVHLSLECNAPDDVLEWADANLKKHSERRAIFTTHMDLGIVDKPKETAGYIHDPKGRMKWTKIHKDRGNSGEQMWDKLYRRHPNLFMILSGDQSRVTALRLDRQADDGHTIHALLSDYMSGPVLRLMRFVPQENRVDVFSLHVDKNQVVEATNYVSDVGQHRFSLNYPMAEERSGQNVHPTEKKSVPIRN